MQIILSPVASNVDDAPPAISGDILTYRGTDYDLSQLPDGGEVEAELPFAGKLRRVGGVIHATLQYCYSTETAEPMQSADWADYTFDVIDGLCPDPIARRTEPEPEQEEEPA